MFNRLNGKGRRSRLKSSLTIISLIAIVSVVCSCIIFVSMHDDNNTDEIPVTSEPINDRLYGASTFTYDYVKYKPISKTEAVVVGLVGNCCYAMIHGTAYDIHYLENYVGIYTVVGVNDNAFAGNDDLRELIISGNVHVGKGAFKHCEKLNSVTIWDDNITFGAGVFEGCTSLKSICFSPSVTKVEDGLLKGCKSLAAIGFLGKITSIGANAFQGTAIREFTVPETVTTIGDGVFKDCKSLTEVVLPSGHKAIVKSLFENCNALADIRIPDGIETIGDYAFKNCESLLNVKFPSVLTSIGKAAFENCKRFTEVILPDSLTSMGGSAFKNCSSMLILSIPISLNAVADEGDPAFHGCKNIHDFVFTPGNKAIYNYSEKEYEKTPWQLSTALGCTFEIMDGVDAIGSRMFYGLELTSIDIPDSVKNIGQRAFQNCKNLTNFELPVNMVSVQVGLFEGCSSLSYVTFPVGLKYVEEYAFKNCEVLRDVTFPATLESIGKAAFEGCRVFSKVTIPDSVKTFGQSAFKNCTMMFTLSIPIQVDTVVNKSDPVFEGCNQVREVTFTAGNGVAFDYGEKEYKKTPWQATEFFDIKLIINDGVKDLGDRLFYGMDITSIDLPDSLISIGQRVFQNCKSLTEIDLPADLEAVSVGTFEGCTSLTNVNMCSKLHCISDYAFKNCTALKNVTFPKELESIGKAAFENCKTFNRITLPDTVVFLGESAFKNCSRTMFLTLPISLNAAADKDDPAFKGCKSLLQITITPGNGVGYDYSDKEYKSTPWYIYMDSSNTVDIIEGVTYIGNNMFNGLKKSVIYLPSTVTKIGDYAFKNSKNVPSVTLPNGLKSLGNGTFEGCKSLSSIKLADIGYLSLGKDVFKGCSSALRLESSAEQYSFEMFSDPELTKTVTMKDLRKNSECVVYFKWIHNGDPHVMMAEETEIMDNAPTAHVIVATTLGIPGIALLVRRA